MVGCNQNRAVERRNQGGAVPRGSYMVVLRQPTLDVGGLNARVAVHGDVKGGRLRFPFEVKRLVRGLAARREEQSAKKSGRGRFS